ncbi:MAG TPA: prolipoprotein diacylglyceryl transferase family protein, partial [Polyangiales bacterium]|nr:prolipoprotein diacylglyceryl transferase family protein [Polyangiales bacterium]
WFFARMGCFCVHDHPGLPSDFALAVADWNGSGIARHDLGLYEASWCVPVALWFWHSQRTQPRAGYYLGLISVAYGPVRFALDFLRTDAAHGGDLRYAGLTPAQYLSAALAVFGIIFLRRVFSSPSRMIALAFGLTSACAGSQVDQVEAATPPVHQVALSPRAR